MYPHKMNRNSIRKKIQEVQRKKVEERKGKKRKKKRKKKKEEEKGVKMTALSQVREAS